MKNSFISRAAGLKIAMAVPCSVTKPHVNASFPWALILGPLNSKQLWDQNKKEESTLLTKTYI